MRADGKAVAADFLTVAAGKPNRIAAPMVRCGADRAERDALADAAESHSLVI